MGTLSEQIRTGCSRTVLTCMDWRLQGPGNLARYLRERFKCDVSYDLICVPGACWGLARGTEAERELHLAYLETSVDLHSPEELIIIPHLQCGRYRDEFCPSDIDERVMLAADVEQAQQLLRQRFPELVVSDDLALVDRSGMFGLMPGPFWRKNAREADRLVKPQYRTARVV